MSLEHAECARVDSDGKPIHDPEDFFPGPDSRLAAAARTRASRACGPCPVAQECFEAALERREKAGIWGGVDIGLMRRRSIMPGTPGHGIGWRTLARRARALGPDTTDTRPKEEPVKTIRIIPRREPTTPGARIAHDLLEAEEGSVLEAVGTEKERRAVQMSAARYLQTVQRADVAFTSRRMTPIAEDGTATWHFTLVPANPEESA